MITLDQHIADTSNPHQVTKQQIDLGNVLNYGVATFPESLDPSVTNKLIVPATMQHALDERATPGNNEKLGLLKINNGLLNDDDIDQLKALSANGLLNLINQNANNFNAIQLALSQLQKRQFITVTSVTGTNQLTAYVQPATPTNRLHGIIRFIAPETNTGDVMFTSGGSFLNVLHWNGAQIQPGELVKNKVYALLPCSTFLILLNPTVVLDTAYIDDKINNLKLEEDPFTQYVKEQDVKDIYNIGFRGSYIGNAVLQNTNYTVQVPSTILTTGVFAITFNSNNPENSTLTINNSTKPLKDFNGELLPANEFISGEVRVVVNTPDSFRVHSVRTQINTQVAAAFQNHLSNPDPHDQYWNDDRGLARINTAVNTHKTDKAAHILVSNLDDGFMSKEDKIKLDAISGTNTGDETTARIIEKLNVVLDMGQI